MSVPALRSIHRAALIMLALWGCPFVTSASASAHHSRSHRPHRSSLRCHRRRAHGSRHRAAHKAAPKSPRTSRPRARGHTGTRCARGHAKRRHRSGLQRPGVRHRRRHLSAKSLGQTPRQLGHGSESGYSSAPPKPASEGPCPDSYMVPAPGNLELIREATLCLINEERGSHGEAPLRYNRALENAAQGHTEDMVDRDYFEHVAPSGSTPLERIEASGYIHSSRVGYAIGENIAWGSLSLATPKAIVDAWMNSPGHRANILDAQYRETAIGVVANLPSSLSRQDGAIYTQDFGVIITG
jgi:uncharacterized protein YkwD